MSRDIFINGESMVTVKSRSDSAIGSLSQLGLADSPIVVTPNFVTDDIIVDAWGPTIPMDVQTFLQDCTIRMTLVHFDPAVLEVCEMLSAGGASAVGSTVRAGTRMGGGVARFAAGNNFIGLNIASPVAGRPYRFYYAMLSGPSVSWPLGTKRSIVQLNWRAIPFTVDPWNSGTGATGAVVFDHTADT